MKEKIKVYKKNISLGINLGNKFYIYDRTSNLLLEVNRCIFNNLDMFSPIELESLHKGAFSQKEFENDFFEKWIPDDSSLEKLMNMSLSELTLNVTEACNNRCLYCFYSEEVKRQELGYNPKNIMSLKVAQKAIDVFLKRSFAQEECTISFIGGEPLLNWNLIKYAVEYAKSKSKKTIIFSIITNASFLKGEILDFLIENNFFITISFDGPKKLHDLNRRSLKNESNFKETYQNILNIRKNNYDYFKRRIIINAVYPLNSNITVFSACNYLKSKFGNRFFQQPQFLYTTSNHMDFYKKYTFNFFTMYKNMHIRGFKSINDVPLFLASNSLHKKMLFFHFRENKSLLNVNTFNPIKLCIPGMKKLYVAYNGDIYPCSEMYYLHKMKIGNIKDCVDLGKVKKYLYSYVKQARKSCVDCWAFRFCDACFLSIANNENELGIKNDCCERIKNDYVQVIKTYIEIIALNKNAFDIYY